MCSSSLTAHKHYKRAQKSLFVKRNKPKFEGDEFMFQLTETEMDILSRSKKSTAIMQTLGMHGGRTSLPYAFTEQGVYMLMTVLKSELATKQSRALVKVFKVMKDYINESYQLTMNTNSYIDNRFASIDKRFEGIEGKIDMVMDNFNTPSSYKHFLIMDGQRIEADIAYQQIYSLAKKTIFIIDDYISIKTLELLKNVNREVEIKIYSDNVNKMSDSILNDYSFDTGKNIVIVPTNNRFHDRYIVIDYGYESECIYHCGSSSKDSGKKITTIVKLDDAHVYHKLMDELLKD